MNDTNASVTRRGFVGIVAASVVLPALPAWRMLSEGATLTARPGKPTDPWQAGVTRLGEDRPAAFLHIPKSYDPAKPIPLVIALHGAGGRSNGPLRTWTPQADAAGFALLVPESAGSSWDAIRGVYGSDVAAIDRAMKLTFARLNVDARRIVIQGFSDGASYGLGLALNNTDLVTRVVANSPGFITRYPVGVRGVKPAVFVSHGRQDQVLSFDRTFGRVVPQLENEGCKVDFHPFKGGHSVPVDMAAEATKFLMR